MKLYEVTGNWYGSNYVKVYVITDCQESAIIIGRRKLQVTGSLTVTELCPDTSVEWSSKASWISG
jgi:hypothetical protein